MLRICSLSVLESNCILLVLVFMYGSETVLWKEKEISRVRAVEMDNLRGLLGIRRIYRVSNAQINKAHSGCSAMSRGWRGIGLPRESM